MFTRCPFVGGACVAHCAPSGDDIEKKWLEFFKQPNLWWDYRGKANKCGDFKHVSSHDVLHLQTCPLHLREKLELLYCPPANKVYAASYKNKELRLAIEECDEQQDFAGGKALHENATALGLHLNVYVANALIKMYSNCGDMDLARQVSDDLHHRNVYVWSSLLTGTGYIKNGQSSVALDLFSAMDSEPDSLIYEFALKACQPRKVQSLKSSYTLAKVLTFTSKW